MSEFKHETVLLEAAIAALDIKQGGIYVDCTLGGGGHTAAILESVGEGGRVFSFDQDPIAIDHAKKRFQVAIASGQLTLLARNFKDLEETLVSYGVNAVDGILYDLGVSSPQFDEASRGFSYRFDAPLDMRMDTRQALNAQIIVNEWSFAQLERIIRQYGEEKFAKQIAREIERRRMIQPIETTGELVDIIKTAIPQAARRRGGHPAKRTFQAIRMAVNDELSVLEASLTQAIKLLKPKGRLACITFHSLEDRIVTRSFKNASKQAALPSNLPILAQDLPSAPFTMLNKKAITASQTELEKNPRAHSARLRLLQRND